MDVTRFLRRRAGIGDSEPIAATPVEEADPSARARVLARVAEIAAAADIGYLLGRLAWVMVFPVALLLYDVRVRMALVELREARRLDVDVVRDQLAWLEPVLRAALVIVAVHAATRLRRWGHGETAASIASARGELWRYAIARAALTVGVLVIAWPQPSGIPLPQALPDFGHKRAPPPPGSPLSSMLWAAFDLAVPMTAVFAIIAIRPSEDEDIGGSEPNGLQNQDVCKH